MSDRELEAFEPTSPGITPLFLDTSALYAYFYDRAAQHAEVTAFFDALGGNELPYRPLYTNQYVADELVTLLLSHADHSTASRALETLRESSAITLLSIPDDVFDRATSRFLDFDDHPISLTDHTIGIQAEDETVAHVLSYDRDFTTLGLTVVPHSR